MNAFLAALVPPLGLAYLRLVHLTTRYSVKGIENWERMEREYGRGVLCSWHNRIMGALLYHRKRNIGAVISKSGDGELLSRAMISSGYAPLRGSSSRGGTGALKGVLRHLKEGHTVVITPDGPRGPRYVAQPGIVFAAQRSELPILPIGVGIGKKKALKSWDRFQVPLPFTTVQIVYGDLVFISEEEGIEEAQKRVARALTKVTDEADALLGVTSP